MKNINRLLFWFGLFLSLWFLTTFALANPASVKCVEDWWVLSIVTDSSWAQSWICTFSGWISCDEWAYYRWECNSWITTVKSCTKEYNPVCWVDWITYSNECVAWDVEIAYTWACENTSTWIVVTPIVLVNSWTTDSWSTVCSLDEIDTCEWVQSETNVSVEEDTDYVKVDVSFPEIWNDIIDKEVFDYVNDYLSNFLHNIWTWSISNNWKNEIDIKWETNTIWSVITYKLEIYTFTWWAHGNTELKTFNFKKDWTLIEFKNENTLDKVAAYSLNYFKQEVDSWSLDTDYDWLNTWLESKFDNYKNWLITWLAKDSLKVTFFFDQYQIAPYVDWIQTIEIDLAKLK